MTGNQEDIKEGLFDHQKGMVVRQEGVMGRQGGMMVHQKGVIGRQEGMMVHQKGPMYNQESLMDHQTFLWVFFLSGQHHKVNTLQIYQGETTAQAKALRLSVRLICFTQTQTGVQSAYQTSDGRS